MRLISKPTLVQKVSWATRMRFEFGKNWKDYATHIDETSIGRSQLALQGFLGIDDLKGRTFLDAGSGSGIHSLVARRLGARVTSFDLDSHSVECTQQVKEKHQNVDSEWTILQGSVLDVTFLEGLGFFDVVYSWGVLHHTGFMWKAIHNIATTVRPGGKLFISIYNDLGSTSLRWQRIKLAYNTLPPFLRPPVAVAYYALQMIRSWFYALRCRLTNALMPGSQKTPAPLYDAGARGMRRWHDCIDWIGGYPYEVAKPEDIFHFMKARGFRLENMKTCGGGHGCNEYLFTRNPPSWS